MHPVSQEKNTTRTALRTAKLSMSRLAIIRCNKNSLWPSSLKQTSLQPSSLKQHVLAPVHIMKQIYSYHPTNYWVISDTPGGGIDNLGLQT